MTPLGNAWSCAPLMETGAPSARTTQTSRATEGAHIVFRLFPFIQGYAAVSVSIGTGRPYARAAVAGPSGGSLTCAGLDGLEVCPLPNPGSLEPHSNSDVGVGLRLEKSPNKEGRRRRSEVFGPMPRAYPRDPLVPGPDPVLTGSRAPGLALVEMPHTGT